MQNVTRGNTFTIINLSIFIADSKQIYIFAADQTIELMMAGLLILCIFIIIIGACIMPWWALPTFFVGAIIYFLFVDRKKY